MPDPVFLYFVKFFSDEAHADQFRAGKLYANRLSYFQDLEDKCTEGRSDRNEAVAAWLQPEETTIIIQDISGNKFEITKNDLAAPVSMSFNVYGNWPVFCVHAIYLDGFDNKDGEILLNAEDVPRFEKQLDVDDKCSKFGNFAVIVSAAQFVERLRNEVLRASKKCAFGLVKYYNPSTFNGVFSLKEIPFHKHDKFAYQREFRFCFPTDDSGNDALILDIGDISSFSCKVEAGKINNHLRIIYRGDPI